MCMCVSRSSPLQDPDRVYDQFPVERIYGLKYEIGRGGIPEVHTHTLEAICPDARISLDFMTLLTRADLLGSTEF